MAQQPRVRDLLEEAILGGELKPGERLRAEALAQRFGTSRTPIREALLQLEGQGLVEVEPNRGAVVRTFDRDDVLDLYEVRALLEPAAAARAAQRISAADIERLDELCADASVEEQIVNNEAFHRIILEAAGSPRLEVAMRAASGIPRAFRSVFWHDDRQRAESMLCHRRIVSAFRAGDSQLAEAVMRMHILGAVAFLEETWPNR
ncbi:GntR family transcriptional regulator [Solirubrobacter ginsenosidimutans]|uniref:GntR family transcriptional regulator n=1 Tax=Solirubrobacter ginsenosidimutans TaxID=490573 RepID=UPI0022CDCC07|nr:GntR family transcriptional regulator [Solirubrobacter ginsenosidimutans]